MDRTEDRNIVVKFLWKGSFTGREKVFQRQLPGVGSRWGRCQFVFDPNASQYDWLAVYDELPKRPQGILSQYTEQLACAPRHSLFITVEPSAIKTYGYDFLNQFGTIITGQEPWAITNSQAKFTQPALRWFYGDSPERQRSYDEMARSFPDQKTSVLSTVCSNKQQTHTLHADRYNFTWRLKELVPELEIFGRGIRPMADKSDALDEFRYHVAVENHVSPHHWTEKLSDAFLGLTLPFYFGCPNASDYFPSESFISIDIHDPVTAAQTIKNAIATNQYQRRLPAIHEARRLVLENYNLFAVIAREVEQHFDPDAPIVPDARILSRQRIRRKSVGHLVRYGLEHCRIRNRSRNSKQLQKAA